MKKLTKRNTQSAVVAVLMFLSVVPLSHAKKSKTISVVTGDWNQDKRLDAAVLMKNKELVELYIFLAESDGLKQLAYKKNIVWTGSMEGTQPYLKATGRGSLLINSENDSVGRNRWQQTLTVSYRDHDFMVAGYTYNSYDTLDLKKTFSCDLNLFTGRGVRNKKLFKINAQKIRLSNWTDDYISQQCEDN